MTFRVTLPDDPDLPLDEEDKLLGPTEEDLCAMDVETSLESIFEDSINSLISITEEVNPPEKIKVIGKLRGALELFNQK